MITPVLPLSINQHRSIDFPSDFSLKCIKLFICTLRQCPHHSHTIRWILLVFYIVLSWFACVPVLTSLLGVGSDIVFGQSYPPYIFQYICMFGDACYLADIFIYSFSHVSSYLHFISNMCVTPGLYHYFCFIYIKDKPTSLALFQLFLSVHAKRSVFVLIVY